MHRVAGLDSLRGVLALWVVFSHSAGYGSLSFGQWSNHFLRRLAWLFQISFNGQAAVVLFFVISGFCIHWPVACSGSLHTGRFLARRFIRIGLPLIGALVFGWCCGWRIHLARVPYEPGVLGVPLWSLWCEMLYYLCYPVLFWTFNKFRLERVFLLSFLPAMAVFFRTAQWRNPAFFVSGGAFFWRTALLGLPFWLLGAKLAEEFHSSAQQMPVRAAQIWALRGVVYLVQGAEVLLAYRCRIGIPLTLFLSMPLIAYWLKTELGYYAARSETGRLSSLGAMSYSIYLIHLSILKINYLPAVKQLPHLAAWFVVIPSVLAISWLFHRFIEAPSHCLAKQVFNRAASPKVAVTIGTDRPFFSICLLAHNSAVHIGAALDSVLCQTDGDWEMIIADDASTDGTANAVRPYLADSRIRYFRHPCNVRQPANWSSAMRECQGQALTTLHADDTYESHALALFRNAMQADPAVEFVWGNWWRCGETLARSGAGPVNRNRRFSGLDACAWLVKNNHALPAASAFRRTVAERIGGPDARFGMFCDRDYFLRLALACEKAACIATPVANYRVHNKSVTHDYTTSGRLRVEMLSFTEVAECYLASHPRGRTLGAILRWDCARSHFREGVFLRLCGLERDGSRLCAEAKAIWPGIRWRPRELTDGMLLSLGAPGRALSRTLHGSL